MYMQNDITEAVSTGPHWAGPRVDSNERMAEIDKVITSATATMPKATMRKLGELSFAIAAYDDDHSYFGQIKSEPIGTSGLEFRFPMPARDTGTVDLDHVAADLVRAAVTVATIAPELTKHTGMVREMAEQVIVRGMGGIASMRMISIGVTPYHSDVMMQWTVDVEMLGSDLSPSVDRVVADDFELKKKLIKMVDLHLARRKTLAQIRGAGAIGWIDDAARATLDVAGVEVGEIVRKLSTNSEVKFSFGGEHGYDTTATFFWVDGTIKAIVDSSVENAEFQFETDELTINMPDVPATLIAALVGRRLREFVDLRYIPKTAIIVETEESGDLLSLGLEIGRSLIAEEVPTAA